MQHVIDAVVVGALDHGDAGGLFDHADLPLVARGAGAVDAGIDIRDVVADGAEAQLRLQLANSVGERVCVGHAGTQDVEGKALRTFGADAGKFAQLLNEARHGLCEA
jgi:hypothetical protein